MPRKRDRRTLMMKFRLTVTHRMPKSEALRLLRQAVRTGYVPEGIVIHYMDWAKGTEGRLNEGQIDGSMWHELQNFYHALMTADIRAEKV